MMMQQVLLAALISVVCHLPHPVLSHGRLWEPPSRSSMWRRGFSTPINYQDNELFCGGFSRQVSNGYKCGICGDPYDGARENEAGGKYATGLISRTYTQGQRATFQVDLTANHKGFFEFKICPTNDPKVKATQECLDLHPVAMADGSGYKYSAGTVSSMKDIAVVLPADLSCDHCVLQWRYHAGNSWGRDPDGTACVGCGPQEEFYGCADIKIIPNGSSGPDDTKEPAGSGSGSGSGTVTPERPVTQAATDKPATQAATTKPATTKAPTTKPATTKAPATKAPTTKAPTTQAPKTEKPSSGNEPVPTGTNGDYMICRRVGSTSINSWCQLNCQLGNCPASHCTCVLGQYPHTMQRPSGCRGAGGYAYVPGYDSWCKANCAAGNCPGALCVC